MSSRDGLIVPRAEIKHNEKRISYVLGARGFTKMDISRVLESLRGLLSREEQQEALTKIHNTNWNS